MYIDQCRLCKSKSFSKVIDLGFQPLADTFLPSNKMNEGPEIWYPLCLGLCNDCGHVFTLYSISPEERYVKNEYSYDSSNSQVSIKHFEDFAKSVLSNIHITPKSLIIDIGSNVGTLLSHFKKMGYENVLGIEPSKNISSIANSRNIRTINKFFNLECANEIKKIGLVDLVLSSNVVNHIDEINELLNLVKFVLNKDGVFVFEVPYLLNLVQGQAFDTIYHEHVHYYGIKPLSNFLNKKGFSIFKVDNIEYMCGSIRVYTKFGGINTQSIDKLIDEELNLGLYDINIYYSFMNDIRLLKLKVIRELTDICLSGGKIIAIGAATKGNTFLNFCRLDSDIISYITDASQLKIGKLTPGSHILIKSDDDIDADITHALILPRNISSYLSKKLEHLNLKFYDPYI